MSTHCLFSKWWQRDKGWHSQLLPILKPLNRHFQLPMCCFVLRILKMSQHDSKMLLYFLVDYGSMILRQSPQVQNPCENTKGNLNAIRNYSCLNMALKKWLSTSVWYFDFFTNSCGFQGQRNIVQFQKTVFFDNFSDKDENNWAMNRKRQI